MGRDRQAEWGGMGTEKDREGQRRKVKNDSKLRTLKDCKFTIPILALRAYQGNLSCDLSELLKDPRLTE